MAGAHTNGKGSKQRPLVFRNARVIDPSRDLDTTGTVIVMDGRIAA
ncbi:MAG TPA: dihydroorotase, partial [Pararhizobium sp.]|nr:dihydroorotase [Pararhizobium sp.]